MKTIVEKSSICQRLQPATIVEKKGEGSRGKRGGEPAILLTVESVRRCLDLLNGEVELIFLSLDGVSRRTLTNSSDVST